MCLWIEQKTPDVVLTICATLVLGIGMAVVLGGAASFTVWLLSLGVTPAAAEIVMVTLSLIGVLLLVVVEGVCEERFRRYLFE